MEDFIANLDGIAASVIAVLSAAGAWLLGRFVWWKAIKSKPLKMATAVVLFLAVALILSAITALFT